jgi:murein DD-endopeptidase MepM/ murein hydrolase activator NlpD
VIKGGEMKHIQVGKRWYVGMVIIITLGISIACVSSGVDPDDPRLLPPISNIGIRFDDFLKQLSLVPSGGIMAPWITQPPDYLYEADSQLQISGWAPYFEGARVVIYDVKPDFLLSKVEQINKELAFTFVKQGSYEWGIELFLENEQQYLAAKLELADGRKSPFSNIVFVSKGKPAELVISSPVEEEIITSENVTLQGTGTPLIHLAVFVNGEKTNNKAQIGPSGNWIIENVPLLISGFDKDSPTAEFKIEVKAEATKQEESVVVRRMEPISLLWPFGQGEGSSYKPDSTKGQVSSFFHDDWHYFGSSYSSVHPALDIVSGANGPKIHAVAAGVISGYGTANDGANYLIIDSGGWGTLYYHLKNNHDNTTVGRDFKPENGLIKGSLVNAGDVIAIEGNTGLSSTGTHLHISVRIWDPNSNKTSSNEFWVRYDDKGYSKPLNKFINLNPTVADRSFFNEKNIDLYDWWGGSPYCETNSCWKDVDWTKVSRYQGDPDGTYASGCLLNGKWTGGYANSPYAMRQWYCLFHPTECKCP